MRKTNAIQERKEKIKPKKLFSINAVIYDDGVISGTCMEFRDLGRCKNQKLIIPAEDDFLASVRSILPSVMDSIEPLVHFIFADIEAKDLEGTEKFARVGVDIYSDGFVDCDFGEIIKGTRGAPKTWRMAPHEFFRTVDAKVGKLSPPLKSLMLKGVVSGEVNVEAKVVDDE